MTDAGTPPLARRLLAELLGSAFLAALVIGSGIAAQTLSPGNVGLQLFENAAATAAGLFTIILMFGPISGGHFNPVVSLADASFRGIGWRDALAYVPVQIAGCMFSNTFAGIAPASVPSFILAQLVGGAAAVAQRLLGRDSSQFGPRRRRGGRSTHPASPPHSMIAGVARQLRPIDTSSRLSSDIGERRLSCSALSRRSGARPCGARHKAAHRQVLGEQHVERLGFCCGAFHGKYEGL
jgi:hypothetical protein